MRKILTIAAAVLASVSMFAADYDPAATAVYTVGDTSTFGAQWKTGLNQNANYFEVADTVIFSPYVLYQSAGSGWQEWTGSVSAGSSTTTWDSIAGRCFKGSAAMFSSGARCATVRSSRVYKYNVTNCIQVMALVKSSSSITLSVNAYEIENNVISSTPAGTATYKNGSNGIVSLDGLDKDKTYRIEILTDNSGSNSSFYEIAFVHPHACQDPQFAVPADGVGFVGDPISLAVSSLNKNKPINSTVTLDGVIGVSGEDFSYSVSLGQVQAIPLKAGTFVIKFTQASNGEYCAAEDSATFVISAKNPVTSFIVEGPTEARIGQEVTLTAKDFDAAATVIEWRDGENEVVGTGATYTFTPDAVGNYQFNVYASNEFNEDPVMEVHNVEVAISDNALLSDLKVNGETVEDFDEETYAYNLGQIGVYEALSVVATPEDAPYATAAVVDNGEGTITVTVTAEDQENTEEYVLTYTRAAATTLASVSESTTWDWANAGSATAEQKESTLPTNAEEFNFADVLINPAESFNAAALAGIAQFANRGTYFQGNKVKFNTTVPGTVVVTYSNTGGSRPYRHVMVNETLSAEGSANQDQKETEAIAVAAGDVEITFYIPDATQPQERNGDVVGPSMGRIYKIVFTKSEATAIDNAAVEAKAVKTMINGQLFILRDGKTYDVHGVEVR